MSKSLLGNVQIVSLLFYIGLLSSLSTPALADVISDILNEIADPKKEEILNEATDPKKDEAQLEWAQTFATPGTSVSIIEGLDMFGITMMEFTEGVPAITIKWKGFPNPSDLVLSQKVGDEYYPIRSNFALITDYSLELGGLIRGQTAYLALSDKPGEKLVTFSVTPFPIKAEGDGVCRASAEVLSDKGRNWVIRVAGYNSIEQVKLTSVTNKKTEASDHVATEMGRLEVPIDFGRWSKGNAQITVEGSGGCKVSLDFAIGKSARKAD